MGEGVRRWLVVAAVVVIAFAALWFKGGEFFCRLRGGLWAHGFQGQVCISVQQNQ
jgi:hypothetical protein